MQNKKSTFIVLLIGCFILTALHAFAAGERVPITGTAFGKNIGLIHFDSETGHKTEGECEENGNKEDCESVFYCNWNVGDETCSTNSDYIIGERNQFFVSPADPNFVPGTGYTSFIHNPIGDECESSGSELTCPLGGYLWSDQIGWIILTGTAIQNAMEDENDFPREQHALIHQGGKNKGALTGYIWSEKTGWISLSSNMTDGTNTPTNLQDEDDWGVWLNTAAEFTSLTSGETNCGEIDKEDACKNNEDYNCIWDEDACTETPLEIGYPFHGYAWSEKLGWIKFDVESSTEEENFMGVYSAWGDSTPPEITMENGTWFAVGENTGCDSPFFR